MSSKNNVFESCFKRAPKPFNSIIDNGDRADFFHGLNIEKPETISPMDTELRIQADRVMFSLNKAVSVLSVMAHLPYLLENQAKILRDNFSNAELSFILYILKLYENHNNDEVREVPSEASYLFDTINKIRFKKQKNQLFDNIFVDGNLMQVINMIFGNKCVRQEISRAQNPTVIPFVSEFIGHFEKLKSLAKIKLYVTGTEEEARDRRLREAFKSNIILNSAIKDLDQQLKAQREQLGSELNRKMQIFETYNKKIANMKEEFQITIEKDIHESEKKMMQQCLESEEKQAKLSEEADAITNKYEKLLEDHLDEENRMRNKTMKTHTELQNWITKYDQDVGDKASEYETLKEQYDQEKAIMDDLEDKMCDQELIYNTLMAEKEAEEEQLYQELALKLLMNRSARIIQRAWRAFRERKKSKRKGKKGKKGKR